MPPSKFKLSQAVCACSINLLVIQGAAFAESARMVSAQSATWQSLTIKPGELPIHLSHDWNSPYYVGYYGRSGALNALFKPGSDPLMLVSINDQSLKDKSENEINSLLVGPVGTPVKLTLVTTGGDCRVVKLLYGELPKFTAVVESTTSLPYIVEAMHPLDGDEGPFAVKRFEEMGKIYLHQGCDLLALGADQEALKFISAWPFPTKYPANKIAIQALSHALSAANIKAADFFWEKIKTSLEFEGSSGRSIAANYPQVIVQLVQAGRRQDAIFLAKKLLPLFDVKQRDEVEDYHFADYDNRHDVLKACAIALAGDSKNEALKVCDQLFELNSDNQWLGEMFFSLGEKEKAVACYKRAIALEEERRGPGSDFRQLARHLFLLKRKSEILKLAGKDSEAAQAISQGSMLCSSLTTDQIAAVKILPQFNAKDFEQSLTTGGAYAALNRAHSLIEQGVAPEKEIAELLNIYENELPVVNSQNDDRSLNKLLAVLNLVRDLSDHKMTAQSNKLLSSFADLAKNRANTQTTALFIDSEAAINSVRSGRADEQKWTDVEAYLTPFSEFSSERFRILALAYATAGDYQRAEIILNHAEARLAEEEKSQLNTSGHILTLLDKANLLNHLGRDSEGRNCFDQALSKLSVLNAQPVYSASKDPQQAEIIELGKEMQFRLSLVTKIIEAAKCDIQKCNFADAEQKLQKALPLTESAGQERLAQNLAHNYSRAKPQQAIRVLLAKLLFARGQTTEAKDLLSKVDVNTWNNTFGDLTVFNADVAAAAGDWNAAMDGYLSAPFSGSSVSPANNSLSYIEFYLRKALEAAKKIPDLSPSKLAAIYQQLGDLYQTQLYKPEQALNFYQEAYHLYPESDSNKAIVADKMAEAKKEILSYEAKKNFNAGIKTAVNINSPEVLSKLAEAATLSEKYASSNRVEQWFKLAAAEAAAGAVDDAIAHAKHATEMIYKPAHEPAGRYSLSQREAIFDISDKGRAAAAEELLLLSAAKTKELYGYPSLEYEIEQANLFEFYLRQNQFGKALTQVDQILAVTPQVVELNHTQNDYGRSGLLNSIPNIATENKNPQLARQILNKFAEASAKYYSSDDYRYAHLLKIKADLESNDDQVAAEADYRKALSIAALDADRFGEYNIVYTALQNFLRKNGKIAEVELLGKERASFEVNRENCSAKAMYGQVVNPESEYFSVSKIAPYSEYASLLLDTMLTGFERNRDTESINKYAPIALDLLNHASYFNYSFCRGQLTPLSARYRYLRMLIAASSQSDSKTARIWLQKALALRLPQPTVDELTFLSQAELLCGNRQAALDFYKGACKLYLADKGNHSRADELIVLRTKLGQREDLKSPAHQ